MTTEPTQQALPTDFYRVEKAANSPTECACDACALWTIVYREHGDTEDTELSQSWQGSIGKETAEDVCNWMNMAFEQALELPPPQQLAKLVESLAEVCVCSEEDSQGACLYCEARQQIEAQARTLKLAQDRLTALQSDLAAEREAHKQAMLVIASFPKVGA